MCCLFFRNCLRCCQNVRPIPPFPPTPIPPRPVMPIVNVGARFNLLAPVDATSGSTIPLSNTVFNNASEFITNNGGTITLAGEGLYLVNYSVTATNNTDATSSIVVGLNVGGTVDASASASGVLGAGSTGTVSNSSLVFVPQGSSMGISLTVTSDETLSLLPNMIVTKLS